jgi:hypothetical protein
MKTSSDIVALILLCMVGAGCGRTVGDNDAIRSAINAHLAGKSNLNTNAFDTEIQKVVIQGAQAEADVAFRVKGGPGTMQLTYELRKTGATWAVVESSPVGSNFTHPALNGAGENGPGSTPSLPSRDIMDAIHEKLVAPPN